MIQSEYTEVRHSIIWGQLLKKPGRLCTSALTSGYIAVSGEMTGEKEQDDTQ
jgi:hypothetical protein